MDTNTLRQIAKSFFDAGVAAADPARAVEATLVRQPLPEVEGQHIIVAVGKAACAMTDAALSHIPRKAQHSAICVTNPENMQPIAGCKVMSAAHPVPDAAGIKAGQAVMDCLRSAGAQDHVLFLISGGGSALLPCPAKGITLQDKIEVGEALLRGGVSIGQANLVRQHLSLSKGGGLARMAAPAQIRTLAVSDVIGDDPRIIASGPTASGLGTRVQAVEVLQDAQLWDRMPASVRTHLSAPEGAAPDPAGPPVEVICSNRQSLAAIVDTAQDWSARVVTAELDGDVTDAAGAILETAKKLGHTGPSLLVWGGETTVNVTGTGKGGRNQELALRFAQMAGDLAGDWVFLSGGTDGRDGPTTAAGGLVDPGTLSRIRAAGGDFDQLLANNDSNLALSLAGDLLMTGPTGTNVADIMLLMRR